LDNDEINEVGRALSLDSLTVEDLGTNFTRDKTEYLNNDALFVVSRESFYAEQSNVLRTTNINILLFQNLIITMHSTHVHSLQHVKHILETRYSNKLPSCDFILYAYLDGVVDLYAVLVQQVEMEAQALDDLVVTLSSNELNELMGRIGMAGRRTVELYETLLSKRDLLATLLAGEEGGHLFTKDTKRCLRNVQDHVLRIHQKMKLTKELINSLNNVYMTKISIEMNMVSNEINISMQKFTAYGAIFLPLTLISGIWGMNVKVPGMIGFDDTPPGYSWFIAIILFMITFAVTVGTYFHRKGLL